MSLVKNLNNLVRKKSFTKEKTSGAHDVLCCLLHILVFTHTHTHCACVCVCALWTESGESSGKALYPRLILIYVKAMAHWRDCTID